MSEWIVTVEYRVLASDEDVARVCIEEDDWHERIILNAVEVDDE